MKLKVLRIIMTLLTTVFLLSACGSDSVRELVFSFDTETASNSYDYKTFRIKGDLDRLEFTAELQMQGEDVEIRLEDTSNEADIWFGSFAGSCEFKIDPVGIKADTDYLLHVTATQCSNVNLTLKTGGKLIIDKDVHGRYMIKQAENFSSSISAICTRSVVQSNASIEQLFNSAYLKQQD